MTGYLVPTGYGEAEFTEKHSRFIGRIWPVENEAEAMARIREMREKHWDASHNVYAYILRENGITRYSDDGEPQGTSGMPTLNVLRGANIYNVCCVVTRYFGGTLLGTGGLMRAYSHTASLTLDKAGISAVRLWKIVLLACSYGQFERVRSEIETHAGVVRDIDYGADVLITALLPDDAEALFLERIGDVSAGTIIPETVGEEFRAVRIEKDRRMP